MPHQQKVASDLRLANGFHSIPKYPMPYIEKVASCNVIIHLLAPKINGLSLFMINMIENSHLLSNNYTRCIFRCLLSNIQSYWMNFTGKIWGDLSNIFNCKYIHSKESFLLCS